MTEELAITCPYCGQPNFIEPEFGVRTQERVEDCAVCCRPILLTIRTAKGGSVVTARRENE